MIEEGTFAQYIFADGTILSVTSSYTYASIELKLQIRKWVETQIVPCIVILRFDDVVEFDVIEHFSTAGNYSDMVLINLADNQYYASFDPFDNSGAPNEGDNFVIKSAKCAINELQ